MLQDYGSRGARIKDPDLVTVDANPLVRYRIVTAVAVAAGRASPEIRAEEEEAAGGTVRAPTADEARAQGRLILLTEDNPTNQDVIRRQLLRLGYACEIAGNGAEALRAWRSGTYALILTDCHMPEMDGYELTGNIRIDERGSGARIPIIAITANALQGEAERCLAAGMDDYLSKPISLKALRDTLRKWMPATGDAPSADEALAPVAAAQAPSVVVDERVIKDMFGDDPATFKDILGSFVEPSQSIIAAVTAARATRDSEEVKGGAHQLKSSARTIGANALADTCMALEAAGRSAEWDAIDRLVPVAERQMVDVLDYIRAL